MDNNTQGLVWLVVLTALYFFPTLVAMNRGVENKAPTFIVNLFLGWTVIGWVIALAMGAGAKTKTKVRVGEREVDLFASRIDSGAMQPIGDATAVTVDRLVIHSDPGLTDKSWFIVARGEDVAVFERRGGAMLVHTKNGSVGWVAASGFTYRPRQQQVGPATATKTCPRCAETIQAAAKICRFCRFEFTPTTADAGS